MLPYIDQHTVRVTAPRDVAWPALEKYLAAFLRRAEGGLLTRLLGAVPRAGFEVAERVPPDRLTLVGRHRFARYQLAFDLTDAADGATHLRATTHAEFPGVRGRVYRALVIGTRAHVVATTHILRSIRRRALKTVACVALAVSAFLGSGARWASAEVPTWIAAEPPDPAGRPLWVSVEAALTTDGSLRSELFSPELVAAMEPPQRAEPEGDVIVTESSAVVPYDCDQSGPSRGREPAELYATSRLILAGRVTDLRQGIFRETVGRLFEVVVEETVKAPAGAEPQHALYLFLREPVVSVRLRRFCIDGASRTPPPIGARVLLLLDDVPAAMPGGVVVPLDNDLFLERPQGRLSAPREFPAEGLSFDALLRGLREAR
jgi:hypothetical protein